MRTEDVDCLSLRNSAVRQEKATVNFKTGRFDNINSAVIISSASKAVPLNL